MFLVNSKRVGSRWENWLFQNKESLIDIHGRDGNLLKRLKHLDSRHYPHNDFFEWLSAENSLANLTQKQKENLDFASKTSTLYIFTGQQPGLGGGPLLWFWKALSAVALAETLSRILNRKHIPIFWIAGDDSDLREVNRLTLLESDEPRTRSLKLSNNSQIVPVGNRVFKTGPHHLYEDLQGVWKKDVCQLFMSFSSPSETFVTHFKSIAQHFLGETGILFLDGNSNRFRQISSPFKRRMIHHSEAFEKGLVSETSLLQAAGLAPQIKNQPKNAHLFSIANGVRERFMYSHNKLKTDSGRVLRFDLPLKQWHLESQTISHDVVSRPLLIEGIAPVVGHVLGPGELGYFFQMKQVFNSFCGGSPLMFPRMRATVVSEGAFNQFKGLGIPSESLDSIKPSYFVKIISQQLWEEQNNQNTALTDLIPEFRKMLQAELGGLWHDKTFERTLPKFHYVLAQFEKKLKKRLFDHNRGNYAKLLSEINWCGRGGGQDRYLNIFSLINRFGRQCLPKIQKLVNPLEWELQIIVIPESGKSD